MQSSCKTMVLLSLAAGASAAESNPLGQVMSLLGDLSATIKKDGEAEAKAYHEYFEWCDDVSKEKQNEITSGTSQKGKLEAKITELASTIENSDTRVGELAEAISSGEADLKGATKIREGEAADFVVAEKELEDGIDTLGRAVTIIEREMQKTGGAAAFAQLNQNTNLKTVVQSLSVIIDAASFGGSDKQRLIALVQAQQGDEEGELGAPASDAYASQSGGIVDVLGDMKEKAETELAELRKSEKTSQFNYDKLKQSLEDQLTNDNSEMDATKNNKAKAEEGKATAEGELETTTADLDDSTKTLKSTQTECMQVANDHEEAVRSRNEELKVIADTTKILAATSGGAGEQTYGFLQTQATMHSSTDLARSEVAALVKKLAKKMHSNALAQLASRITAVIRYERTSSAVADPFVKIRGMIADMISKLENEASAEATEKAYCDEELSKTEAKKQELDADIEKLTTSIDQASAKSAELKQEVKVLQEELATMSKEQADADAFRKEAHAVYVTAKADLEKGLGGVRKALALLRDYYAAGGAAALVQEGEEQPAAPAAHEASTGAGGSIIGILEVVESDMATNLAKIETQEEDEQSVYDQSTQENKVTKTGKDQDVKYKTQEFTGLDKTITELSGDRDTNNNELSAVMEYYGKLKGRCIAKPESYEERKKRREAEITGLKEALNVLENEAALIQHTSRGGRHLRAHRA